MAKFFGYLEDEKQRSVQKIGRHTLYSHQRGWNFGITTTMRETEEGHEEYSVYQTGGSNGTHETTHIVTYIVDGETGEVIQTITPRPVIEEEIEF